MKLTKQQLKEIIREEIQRLGESAEVVATAIRDYINLKKAYDNPNYRSTVHTKFALMKAKDKLKTMYKNAEFKKQIEKEIPNFSVESLTESQFKEIIREELKKSIIKEWRAEEVLKQLGGNKFIAMTGAKQFVKSDKDKEITFKIGGGAKNGINYVRITLTSMDVYNIEFLRLRGNDLKVVASVDGVYNDQLQSTFTKHTGMRTSL